VGRADSDKLPLGIQGEGNFDASTRSLATDGVHHVILYSDGLVEAQNVHGEAFGDHGLAEALTLPCSNCNPIQLIKSHVISFLDGLEPHDDISLLALNLGAVT
jgi:serine phosphatase RsbU (regulator of sigma subunit)